ncbi:MAG: AI-2E family transporter [Actinomycetota bacterium]|nr:AI-2E family transporter [Actinomycetota bacterium]
MASSSERTDNRNFRRRTLVVFGVLVATAGVLWLVYRLSTILFMVFVSLFVAVAIEPPVHYLEKRGWRRGAATGVVFLAAFALVVVFLVALVPLFVEQVNQFVDATPEYVESVALFLEDSFGIQLSDLEIAEEGQNLADIIGTAGGSLLGGVIGVTTGVFSFVFFASTVAIFSFYIVAELPQLQHTVLSFMPQEQQRDAMHVWDIAVEKMGGYIYSRLILAILSGLLSWVVLSFLNVPFALSLGIWVGVLSQFIPIIGTYLAAILPAVVALSANGPTNAVWVIVYFVAYQQLENYLVAPRITRRTMQIHPAVSIAAILIGGTLLGGIGIILALPMTGIIQALISESSANRHEVIADVPEPAAET